MRTLGPSLVGMVMLALLATSSGLGAMPVRAADASATGPGLVTGPAAHAAFETLARDGAVTFIDFEGVSTGPLGKLKLDGPAKGITVRLRTTEFRYPLPPKRAPKGMPALVLPYGFVSAPANHRLMGSNPGDRPDGQAKYKLVLSKPVSHVGLLRMWNTYSLTRFYNETGTLLAEHRNTENREFVAYVAAGLGDRVKSIEFDGAPEQPGDKSNRIYHVGEVDDLYVGYGSARNEVGDEEESSSIDDSEEELAAPGSALGRSDGTTTAFDEAEEKRIRAATWILKLVLYAVAPYYPTVPTKTLVDIIYTYALLRLLS